MTISTYSKTRLALHFQNLFLGVFGSKLSDSETQCSTLREGSERVLCGQAVGMRRDPQSKPTSSAQLSPMADQALCKAAPAISAFNPLASDRALQRSGATFINQT